MADSIATNAVTSPKLGGGVPTRAQLPAGSVLQVVNFTTGVLATGSTAIPADNTIPQITEGNQYMSLSITPTSASSTLKVDVVWIGSANTTGSALCVALFRDSGANALATSYQNQAVGQYFTSQCFTSFVASGSAALTTFTVRAGVSSGTTTFNGVGTTSYLGGSLASSITITEIAG